MAKEAKADGMSAFIIGGTLYKLKPEKLLCEWETLTTERTESGGKVGFDLFPTRNLIYIPGDAFILDAVTNGNHKPRIINEAEARKLMDEHPAGIHIDAYRRKFGDPPEVE